MCHSQWLSKVESVWETCNKDLTKTWNCSILYSPPNRDYELCRRTIEISPHFPAQSTKTVWMTKMACFVDHTSVTRMSNLVCCYLSLSCHCTLKVASLHTYVCNDKIRLFVCKSLPLMQRLLFKSKSKLFPLMGDTLQRFDRTEGSISEVHEK